MKILLEIDDVDIWQLEICSEQTESKRIWIRNSSGLTTNPNSPQYNFRGQLWINPLATLSGAFIPINGSISLDLSKPESSFAENTHHFSCWYNTWLERLSLLVECDVWLRLLDFETI